VLVADRVADLPGLGANTVKPCPGVRFLIYNPEDVLVQVIEWPRDQVLMDLVYQRAEDFWLNHVIPGIPPTAPEHVQPVKLAKTGGTYTPVEGEAWQMAMAAWVVAREHSVAAERRLASAKATITTAIQASGLERVILPSGHKFSYTAQAGRRTFDKRRLAAEHPEIDLKAYETQGAPFSVLRGYGASEAPRGDGGVDDEVAGIHDELGTIGLRDLGPEALLPLWDDLRDRAELYARALRGEASQLDEELNTASEKVSKRLLRRS
jgi:hypothetical protein